MSSTAQNTRRNDLGDDRGYTLVELLVVIVLIGILVTVSVFAIGGLGKDGGKKACQLEVKSVNTAINAYYSENKVWIDGSALPLSLLVPGYLDQAPSASGPSGRGTIDSSHVYRAANGTC
jgi:prepilin-type N-terminal cleavage/methylation domain-containing protein